MVAEFPLCHSKQEWDSWGRGGQEVATPRHSKNKRQGLWWVGNLSVLCFEQGRGWWWQSFPSVTRNGSGRGGQEVATPPSLEKRVRGVVVGRKPLRLVFRAREGVVVAEFPLRHSKQEWEGWSRGVNL